MNKDLLSKFNIVIQTWLQYSVSSLQISVNMTSCAKKMIFIKFVFKQCIAILKTFSREKYYHFQLHLSHFKTIKINIIFIFKDEHKDSAENFIQKAKEVSTCLCNEKLVLYLLLNESNVEYYCQITLLVLLHV